MVPSATAVSEYENGTCTATFDISDLLETVKYSAVLSVEYRADVRNVTLSDAFSFEENGCTWVGKE